MFAVMPAWKFAALRLLRLRDCSAPGSRDGLPALDRRTESRVAERTTATILPEIRGRAQTGFSPAPPGRRGGPFPDMREPRGPGRTTGFSKVRLSASPDFCSSTPASTLRRRALNLSAWDLAPGSCYMASLRWMAPRWTARSRTRPGAPQFGPATRLGSVPLWKGLGGSGPSAPNRCCAGDLPHHFPLSLRG